MSKQKESLSEAIASVLKRGVRAAISGNPVSSNDKRYGMVGEEGYKEAQELLIKEKNQNAL